MPDWWRLACHLNQYSEQQLQGRWVQNEDLLPGTQVPASIHLHSCVISNIMVLLVFCSPLTWIEEKGPGLKRNRHLSFHFKSGSLENVPNVGVNKNIFLKDQNIFVRKLLGQFSEMELAAEKKRILHCLWLAEEIQKHCC